MTRRFVLGTAGHVDHGKTTLVKALTGVDTDRLPEEKARGISIELGFAPLDLGHGVAASVVDVPGHRRLVRAMIAGAAGIEVVLLVVAADEGVMPQTREHVAVCRLLGIDRAVVAVTKLDVAGPELAAMAGEEARALLGAEGRAEAVACSARTGAGLDELRAALGRALEAAGESRRPAGGTARLGVDRVFSVRGAGTVVTGTLVSGRVAVGEPLFLVGQRGPVATTARALHVHDAPVPLAEAPTRLAVNLPGLAVADVHRGDVLTADPHLGVTTLFDARALAGHGLRRGMAVVAYVGTASSAARVDSLQATEGGAIVRLRLAQPLPAAGGDRVVLRGGASGKSGAVVGGGPLVDVHPDRRASGARRRALASALGDGDPRATVLGLVSAAAPRPLALEALASRFALSAASLVAAANGAAAEGALAKVGQHGWMAPDALEALVAEARKEVKTHERDAPFERGLPLETLRARLSSRAGRDAADEAVRRAIETGPEAARLAIAGDAVRSAAPRGAPATSDPRVARVRAAVGDAGKAGATERALGEQTVLATADLRSILSNLARGGACQRAGELWFSAEVVAEARRVVLEHFARSPTLTVVELKEAMGLARKQAVLLLEHLDEAGLTRRKGDVRLLR